MSKVPPTIREFARRLIALEAARDDLPGAPLCCAARVCDRLRGPLVQLSGVAGFSSLLARGVALAKAEVSELAGVQVRADGKLDGLDGLPNDGVGGVLIVARLLDLLVTFIGKPLTMRLVQDAWPDETVTGPDAENGGQP